MCGSTAQQNQIEGGQQSVFNTMNTEAQSVFGQNSALYNNLVSGMEHIFNAGPSQEGFSAPEKAALDTEATSGVTANYERAATAVGEQNAGAGGGNLDIPSGQTAAERGEIASEAAGQESGEEQQITEADYAQGEQNYNASVSGLLNAGEVFNPSESLLGEATGAGTAAANTANQIAQANEAPFQAVVGALGEVGGMAAGGFCPAEGSMYLMADGSCKPVELLKVGDRIMGIDGEAQTIEEILEGLFPLIEVRLANSYRTVNSLTHAFALPKGGFTVASRSLGKQVLTSDGPSEVLSITPFGHARVFNVITGGSHTYRADGVWALGVGEAERQVSMDEWRAIGDGMFKDRTKWSG
jgi:hypothetical protein